MNKINSIFVLLVLLFCYTTNIQAQQSVQIPNSVKMNHFEQDIIQNLDNEEDKQFLIKYYDRNDDQEVYQLKKGLRIEIKNRIYRILNSVGYNSFYCIMNRNSVLKPFDNHVFEKPSSNRTYYYLCITNNKVREIELHNMDRYLNTNLTLGFINNLIDKYQLQGSSRKVRIQFYEKGKKIGNQELYHDGNTTYIKYYFLNGLKIAIYTPYHAFPTKERIYIRKIEKYQDMFLNTVSYYDDTNRLKVKIFYEDQQIKGFKFRQYSDKTDTLIRESYFTGDGEKYIDGKRYWKTVERRIHLFNPKGLLEASFDYDVKTSTNNKSNIQYSVFFYNRAEQLIKKESYLIGERTRQRLSKRITQLIEQGISRKLYNLPSEINITNNKFGKLTYNPRRKRLYLRGNLSETEKDELINMAGFENKTFRSTITALYRTTKNIYILNSGKHRTWHYNEYGNLKQIDYYLDNRLSKVEKYNDLGNIEKIDRYTFSGDLIIEEE